MGCLFLEKRERLLRCLWPHTEILCLKQRFRSPILGFRVFYLTLRPLMHYWIAEEVCADFADRAAWQPVDHIGHAMMSRALPLTDHVTNTVKLYHSRPEASAKNFQSWLYQLWNAVRTASSATYRHTAKLLQGVLLYINLSVRTLVQTAVRAAQLGQGSLEMPLLDVPHSTCHNNYRGMR